MKTVRRFVCDALISRSAAQRKQRAATLQWMTTDARKRVTHIDVAEILRTVRKRLAGKG